MSEHNADIVIFGAGIAGLWALDALKKRGYDVLLLEKEAIGSGQTIASQGIIHSGLKYALAGKIIPLVKSMSGMRQRWQEKFGNSCTAAQSQQLFIPKGFVGGITKIAAQKALANTHKVDEWPAEIQSSGFEGSIVAMDEPVLNVPQVIRAMADKKSVRKINMNESKIRRTQIETGGHTINAKAYIFTAGDGNRDCALGMRHKVESQKRPLLMGMMKNAPFPLFAHFVGKTDKPVATITTHKTKSGALVWYVGGSVAERPKDSDPEDVYDAIRAAFAKYMPDVDLSKIEWAVLPIDRAEGKSRAGMPKAPIIRREGNTLYCWPTKLTFAPLLADMIAETVQDITPSNKSTDWSFLPEAAFAETPWDTVKWKK